MESKVKIMLHKINLKRRLAIKILLKSVTYAFALFGLLFILLLFVLSGMLMGNGATVSIPQNAVLALDMDEPYAEIRRDNLLTDMGSGMIPSFADVLVSINLAAHDNRIKALSARIGNSGLGLAQMQELREAIEYFRAQGKKAYLYSTGFGRFGGGTSEFYLASVFDEITMMPNSEVGITGVSIEVPFVREVLDNLGILPEFYTRYEHKNAMTSFTDKLPPKIFSDEMKNLAFTLNEKMADGIVAKRFPQKKATDFMNIYNQAPLSAEDARQHGLIDEISYESDWKEKIKKNTSGEFISINDYAANWSFRKNSKGIALLVIEGAISEGTSMDNPVSSEAVVGSDTVLAQIEDIAKNKNIKAVVVRVNSPGGSYIASNEIRHALVKLKKERNIPLIVSMGNYAASGGYFVALAGDKIFADEMSITGSIGVLGGKIVLEELWKKIGVNWLFIDTGETAGVMSMNRRFNARQKELFNKSLDRVYADFVQKVSEARQISVDELDKLARGRVWVGMEAQKKNLVDVVGGLTAAMAEAKKLAGFSEAEAFSIMFYPKQKTLQEKISELTGGMQVVSAKYIQTELGLDISDFYMLKRLQYDAVLMPFIVK